MTSVVERSEELSGSIRPRYCAKSMARVEEHTRDERKTRNELPRLRGLTCEKGASGLPGQTTEYVHYTYMYLYTYVY